jgi:putative ABC transport system permease protein
MLKDHSFGAWEPGLILKFFLVKEFRRYPFFFFLLILTLTLGTGGILGIHLVSGEVRERLSQNANELLSSDLSLSSRREISDEVKTQLETFFSERSLESYELIDIYSMAQHPASGQSRLVEIRGVEGNYPFHGRIKTNSGEFHPGKLYISHDLFQLWGVQEGEDLIIGSLRKKIDGIIMEDPSQGFRGFSLAPRIYLPLKNLKESGLITLGTSGSFSFHYLLGTEQKQNSKELEEEIYKVFPDPSIKVSFPEDTSEQSARVISIITSFMSLSSLIGLILSLIGIFYLYQSHLQARLKDLSLLHLFGLSKLAIVRGVLIQFSIVFIVVMGVDLLLLIPLYEKIAPFVSGRLGIDLPERADLGHLKITIPILYFLSVSILIPLFFGLFRTGLGRQLKSQKTSLGRFRYFDFIPFTLGIAAVSIYLAQNRWMGGLFFLSLVLVFIFSTLWVQGLQWILRRYTLGKGLLLPTLEAGVAIRGVMRSGHKLTMSFLSLSLGATLISFVLQLDHKIQGELSLSENKPSLFLFDIQEEQTPELIDFAKEKEMPLEALTPMVRARLERVNGKKFEKKKNAFSMRSREDSDDPRLKDNAVNLTYREFLTSAEKIVEGRAFPESVDLELAPVSVEKRWAQRMGIEIGDKLTFDVQGVDFEGEVWNIKEIRWTSFYPNFFLTVAPGYLEGAPKSFLAVLPNSYGEGKAEFQREVVALFPNISFIDVEELISKLSGIFEQSRQAIELISWLSLFVGVVILYGLSHDQVYRRHYDLALLKSLGFTQKRLLIYLFLEFGTLFIMSVGLGFFLGWLMANSLGREIFKLPFDLDAQRMIFPMLMLSVLCLLTLTLSSWRAVRAKPRELLSDF